MIKIKERVKFNRLILAAAVTACLFSCSTPVPEEIATEYKELPDQIDFNYHVKPILSDKCYHCHGPDKGARKAELRLDTEEGAFAALRNGGHAFSPGSASSSVAIDRILSADPAFHMPPPESSLTLTKSEIATLYKWVEQGAEWKQHWSFIPPVKPPVPEGLPADWRAVNEVDKFVLAKIQAAKLNPSPPADKERLLRRVTIDLTGLPPSTSELDDFLADNSPSAYEKVVDRLLKSDAHAERLTMEWMDVSRYADSHGMHADGYRYMWPWRDWVIKSFRKNLPFDEFVTMQLAGDLMPGASHEQILATAFNRNHPMTDEGGVIDEEFRLKYVADRTITTATAFLGLTVECASCHDHKFDPISQKEFYQLSAFFNNLKELGMTGADGNYGPVLVDIDSVTGRKIDSIKTYLAKLEKETSGVQAQLVGSQRAGPFPSSVDKIEGLAGYFPLESFNSGKDTAKYLLDQNPLSFTKSKPVFTKGKKGSALVLTGEYDELYLQDMGLYEANEPFSATAWINTSKKEKPKTQTIMGNTGQKNNFWRGWDFFLDDENRLNVRLVSSLPHCYFHAATLESVNVNEWTHVAFSYDGSGKASGVRIYKNGEPLKVVTKFDQLYKTVYPVKVGTHVLEKRALQVGKSYRLHTGEFGIFIGSMDEIRLYNRDLTALEFNLIYSQSTDVSVAQAKNTGPFLYEYVADHDPALRKMKEELKGLRGQLVQIVSPIEEVMVMGEMAQPRQTFVLQRGQYDSRGDSVSPGTPASILAFPKDLPQNRLGLAQWILDPKNPLTARVTVNRYWQMIFGTGLVKTANDFGSQGSLPSHPELLDWLAVDFVESGWDVRALLRQMVMSATYQQTSFTQKDLAEVDPENRLLARSPSYRWQAEIIRDNALMASGVLAVKVGGESVKPYQPDLWKELNYYSRRLLTYKQDTGRNLYRRSMYTFIRRTSPPPFMTIFDAPNRDVCTINRERTSTPLQALVLLNDPQFVEAAKILAVRMLKSGSPKLDEQLNMGFRLATSRKPTPKEVEILRDLFVYEKNFYSKNPADAKELLKVGESRAGDTLSPVEVAAMTIVASTVLNHDETYVKR